MVETRKSSRADTVQQITTPGGLKVWLVENYAVPLIALDFVLAGGAAQDPVGKAGAATMLAGLLDEGAGPYDAEAFHKELDTYAIEMSFGADHDHFSGRMRTLNKHLRPAFDLLRLALNEAGLEYETIERVRGQLLAGIRRDAHDPHELASAAWRELAFPNHPYSHATHGTLGSVAAVTRADLLSLRTNCFTQDGLHIAVVGAIDAKTLSAELDQVFATLPQTGARITVPAIDIQNLGVRKIIPLDIPQATIQFGLPGIARHDPDHVAGFIVNHIFGGGSFSARLFKEVREKRGLAYSVHSGLATYEHTSLLMGSTSTKNERALESLSVIEDEIAKMASDGPTEEELVQAKKYLTGSYALRFDTSTKIASQLVHLSTEGFTPAYLDERNLMIEAVTLADARRVARRLFADKKLLVTIAGKPDNVEAQE